MLRGSTQNQRQADTKNCIGIPDEFGVELRRQSLFGGERNLKVKRKASAGLIAAKDVACSEQSK